MALFVQMEMGDVLDIDKGKVQVTFQEKSGRRATVRVDADPSIQVNQLKGGSSQIKRKLNKL